MTASLRSRLRAVFAFGLALVAAGCSNNPNPTDWNREETYFAWYRVEPTSFDPSVSYNVPDAEVMDSVYPSYFRFNFLKQKPWELNLDVGLVEPTRVPLSGTDSEGQPFHGEKWTFEIRHDLRYPDDPCFPEGTGRNVTAADLVYAFKRLADPKTEFPLADNVSGRVLGWKEYATGFGKTKADKAADRANYDRDLPGVKVDPTNPYRFSVSLSEVYPQLRYLMAMHFTTPIPREAVEYYGDKFALHHTVGCGPFKLVEYTPHERVVLERNLNSPGSTYPTSGAPGINPQLLADAGKKIPFVKRVVFKIITESITSFNLFDQGYFDSIGVVPSNVNEVLHGIQPGSEMIKRGVEILQGAYPTTDYLAFNMEDPTFGGYTPDKRKLRQAISLAFDSKAYCDLIYQGLAIPAQFLLPRGLCGFDADYKNPYREYDPKLTRAKELLAEAGYPNAISEKTGERLTIYYDNYTDLPSDLIREALYRKELQQLGLKVISRDSTFNEFQARADHKKVQFFNLDWVADYPDTENFCFLLYSKNHAPGPNVSNYHNPEYDRLFEQMRSMEDSPARAEIIHKMRDIAVEDCPWIYIAEVEGPTVYQPWVGNKQSNPMLMNLLEYRKIDAPARESLQNDWNHPVWVPAAAIFVIVVIGIVPAVRTVKLQRNRRVRRPDSGSRH